MFALGHSTAGKSILSTLQTPKANKIVNNFHLDGGQLTPSY